MLFLRCVPLKTDSKGNILLSLAMLSKFSGRVFIVDGKVVQTVRYTELSRGVQTTEKDANFYTVKTAVSIL